LFYRSIFGAKAQQKIFDVEFTLELAYTVQVGYTLPKGGAAMLFNTAKVMSKGQITLPIDIRQKLKLQTGDRVALIYENDRVIMMNPAIYAMENLTQAMDGEWEKVGIKSEDDILELCYEVRAEVESR
jgi:AbrB family looped-hinge helix DNA binding protein